MIDDEPSNIVPVEYEVHVVVEDDPEHEYFFGFADDLTHAAAVILQAHRDGYAQGVKAFRVYEVRRTHIDLGTGRPWPKTAPAKDET